MPLPCVDLRFIDIPRGGGVREEERQRQPLVHMSGRLGVGINDLFRADLIGVWYRARFSLVINGAG